MIILPLFHDVEETRKIPDALKDGAGNNPSRASVKRVEQQMGRRDFLPPPLASCSCTARCLSSSSTGLWHFAVPAMAASAQVHEEMKMTEVSRGSDSSRSDWIAAKNQKAQERTDKCHAWFGGGRTLAEAAAAAKAAVVPQRSSTTDHNELEEDFLTIQASLEDSAGAFAKNIKALGGAVTHLLGASFLDAELEGTDKPGLWALPFYRAAIKAELEEGTTAPAADMVSAFEGVRSLLLQALEQPWW